MVELGAPLGAGEDGVWCGMIPCGVEVEEEEYALVEGKAFSEGEDERIKEWKT